MAYQGRTPISAQLKAEFKSAQSAGTAGSLGASWAGAPAGSRPPPRRHSCEPPCVPGLARHMCGFRMFKPQASNNPLFLFLALSVCLGSFVYFLKIFPFGLCFLACPIFGFSKCDPHWTPMPFITPHPENEGKLFSEFHFPRLERGLGTMVPSPLHQEGEGPWRTLRCYARPGSLSLTGQVIYPRQRNPIFSSSHRAF